ncbi:mediator of RNA polymerase II transcription subunit 10 isoform X7 [Accipiter gentilis]|uniref:mediator of RNA polymerase II transcription subunit 10 isoform X7 n=1 Tax=Astur gentilis TaxID=8957 RepID=UPI0021100C92|nr:mediator of RNA polymerase II transcription subunit 10 isoform X7 [Accipiter gentilis]
MRRRPEVGWGKAAVMAMAEKFDSLEEHLEKFVENIRQLGIIVSDFQPSSQAGLNQKLNFMVTGLQDIDKCRQQLHDISVPLEVFEYIDQGRNPQLYTKECLERALAKNEQVKGKIDTMKKFKSLLIQELTKVFPEDMAKYKAIRGEDPPP